MNTQAVIARVLLDTPLPQLDHTFEYLIPEHLSEQVRQGSKVSVPLRGGARFTDAYVTEVSHKQEFPGELQSIEKVISLIPVLLPETLRLARAVADRQAGSAIDVLRLAIPPRYVRTEKAFVASEQSAVPVPDITIDRPEEFVQDFNAGSRYAVLVPPRLSTFESTSVPNWVQLAASQALSNLRDGKSSIIAMPDFRDVKVVDEFFAAVGLSDHAIRVDASLTGQERYSHYLRSISQEPVIIVGNRSSVLAPAHNLGLIFLWDDGDHNFEEPLAPYAHARDVALLRQAQTECSLVLASHSRSLETQRLVEIGWLSEVHVDSVPTPRVVLTDREIEEGVSSVRIPAQAVLGAKEALKHGPVLVQVASPGFAPALACSSCRERADCVSCHGPLGLKHRDDQPQCKWCGKINAAWLCRKCGGTKFRAISAGTERTSSEIGKAFPGVKIVVADGDHIVTNVSGEPSVVVSTPGAEPQALGGYSAIVLLDGERLRGRQSYRVDEDVLRDWSNAIALGRFDATIFLNGAGSHLGETIVNSGQVAWASQELADRFALRLPPAVRVVSISGALEVVKATCDDIPSDLQLRVLGPLTQPDGSARAIVFFEFKHGEVLAKHLRSAIITSATMSKKRTPHDVTNARVLRLRVRFDDSDIDSL